MNTGAKFPIVLIVFIYFFLGSIVLFKTPYSEFPDEEGHLQYTDYVLTHWRLPVVPSDPDEFTITEASQPPLYYILAAGLSAPFNKSVHVLLLRSLTLLFAALSLVVIWKTSLLIFPSSREVAALSSASAAFNAQYIFTNAGISNNSLAILLCSLTIFYCIRMVAGKTALWIPALFFGLAIFTRITAAFLLPFCVVVIVDRWKRNNRLLRDLLVDFAMFSLVSFVTGGWLYSYNWIHYGDPFLYQVSTNLAPQFIRHEPISWFYISAMVAVQNASFWAYFGPHRYHAGILEYSIYLLLEVLAVIGVYELFFKRKSSKLDAPITLHLYKLLILAFLFAFLQFVVIAWKLEAMQGRYLYVAISPISIILGSGLGTLIPEKYRKAGFVGLSAFLLLFCVYLLLRYWLPHYA